MTRDSMRTSARNAIARIEPPAPGFRAIPSQAATAVRPCESAPPKAASPIAIAAERWPHPAPPPVFTASSARAKFGSRRASAVRTPAGRILFNMSGAPFVIEKIDFVLSMLVGGGSAQINGGQEREDVGLQKRREDAQRHHRPRHDDRNETRKNAGGRVLAEDVPEETHGKRKRACEDADHLDQEHERRQHQHRAEEMLEVAEEPVLPDPGCVEEDEARDRERERDVQVRRRRLQEKEEPAEAGQENEEEKRADDRQVFLAVMRNVLLDDIAQKVHEDLEHVLRAAGSILAIAPRHEEGKNGAEKEDDEGHRDVIRNPAKKLAMLPSGRDAAHVEASERDAVPPPWRGVFDGAEQAGHEGVEEPEENRMFVVHVVPALTGLNPSRSGGRSRVREARRSPPRRPPSRGPRSPTGRRPVTSAAPRTGRDRRRRTEERP